MVIINTATDSDILQARSISNNGVGIRTSSVARIITMPTAKIILLCEPAEVLSPPDADKPDLSETAITIYSPEQSSL
jgi:hypothetical protein